MNLTLLLAPIALAVTLTLPGCGVLIPRKDPTRYYVLEASARDKVSSTPQLAVGIGPVTIPGYLDHKEIVTAQQGSNLKLAPYQVWAEPLEKAVTRVVAQNVSALLNSPSVVPFPDADVKQDYKAAIVIRRFELGMDGKIHLEASYNIEGAPGSNHRGSARSRSITTGVTTPDDYSEIAQAMSRALADLSQSLARDLLAFDRKHRQARQDQ